MPDLPGGTVALFSCSKGQTSHESKTHNRGFLFHHVIEGLGGKAANKKTGEVTWLGLANYVEEELPDAVSKEKGPKVIQTPEVRGEARKLVLARVTKVSDGSNEKPPNEKIARDPKPGEERSVEIAKGVEMVFCWIPAGEATLGSPAKEKDRHDDEKEHEYKTKGFWMGKYLVTQEQWQAVMKANPSDFSAESGYKERVKGLNTTRFPVEKVSWDDCVKFLEKLDDGVAVKALGMKGKLSLPHEDEWEYAYRGGKGNKQAFYWGDKLNGAEANCDGNHPYGTEDKGPYLKRTTNVGDYAKAAPHPWGLCDMSGNVYQWCENLYNGEQKYRVLHGGSWLNAGSACRGVYRHRREPVYRNWFVGVRLSFRLDS